MADDPPHYRRRGALARAVGIHGTDTEEEYFAHPFVVLFQTAIDLIPVAIAGGAGIGATFASGVLFWGLAGVSASFAWPSIIGLAGAAQLLIGMRAVALIYKDRLVVQQGSRTEDILWDDVEAVYVCTQKGNSDSLFSYLPGNHQAVWVETEVPLAKFWMEWTEVHTRDGRVIRLPSTISDYENLSRAVQQATSARLVPKAIADLRAGRAVEFGPLTVAVDGFKVGNFRLLWDDHQCSWAEGGQIMTIDKLGIRVGPEVLTEQVPNWAVASYLIHQTSSGSLNSGNAS